MNVRMVFLASVSAAFLAASAAVSGLAAATVNPNALLAQEAYKSLSSGNAAAAVAAYGKAIESRDLAPEVLANALINRGLAFQHLDQHAAAIDDYTAALRLDAMSASLRAKTLYNRGLSQQKMNQPALAIEDYTSALFLDSEFAHAYLSRANMLRDSGQFLFALSDYEKAIRFRHPDTARVHYGEALTFTALKRPEEARRSLDRALAANPAFAPALRHLAGFADKPPGGAAVDPIMTASIAGNDLVARKAVLPEPVAPEAELMAVQDQPKVILAAVAPKRKLFTDRVPADQDIEPAIMEPVAAAPAEDEKIVAIEALPDEPVAGEAPAIEQPSAKGWSVQLASASSEDAAWSTWKKLQNRFKALAQEKPVVMRADLGTKGIFYRIRLTGFEDQEAAKDRCSRLKRKGVACFISKMDT